MSYYLLVGDAIFQRADNTCISTNNLKSGIRRRFLQQNLKNSVKLFTSYKPLRHVYQSLKESVSEIPLYQMTRGRSDILESFKASGEGVLLATGSMWEGINIPGDILSHLIIVKLPFPIPDPLSDFEKTCFKTTDDYVKEVLVPQMLIILRQGAGRLIRNEIDSGVISILDSREALVGKYHKSVVAALPECDKTSSIEDIRNFNSEKRKSLL